MAWDATSVRSEWLVDFRSWTVRDPAGDLWLLKYTQRKCRTLLTAIVLLLQMRYGFGLCLNVIAVASVASVACCLAAVLDKAQQKTSQKARNRNYKHKLWYSSPWFGTDTFLTFKQGSDATS